MCDGLENLVSHIANCRDLPNFELQICWPDITHVYNSGKEHQLIGEGVITVVRSSLKGENVCFLDFSPSISECTEGGDSADSDEVGSV